MNSFLYNKYTILLLSIFSHMVLDIGGEVSPSFLVLLFLSPHWIQNIKWKRDRIARIIIKIFLAIIVIQIIWAILYSETIFFEQLKGIMVTASGLMYFMFYYVAIRKNDSAINWFVLGTFIASFFFFDMGALRKVESVYLMEEGYLWKFQIFPRIVSAVVCIYMFFRKYYIINRFAPIAFVIVGMVGLSTGSRNYGLTPLLAGGIIFILNRTNTVDIRKIRNYFILGFIVLYLGYAFFYVPRVLNGDISGGNTEQLKKADNPYNPFQLLAIGRAEAIIPFQAFLDKPIFGWGFHTKDPDYKYHRILWDMHKETKAFTTVNFSSTNIPGHSIWGYYSCSYGIIVFILWGIIIYKITRLFFFSLICKDNGILFRTYLMAVIFWDLFFNPLGAFKLTTGTYMAFLVALSIKAIQNNNVRFKF